MIECGQDYVRIKPIDHIPNTSAKYRTNVASSEFHYFFWKKNHMEIF